MCIGPLAPKSNVPQLPPPVEKPPPVVDTTKDNEASAKARKDQQDKALLAGGLQSTIQTSPLGDQSQATVQKPSLLGYTQ